MSCDPSDLSELAKCFAGISPTIRESINTYLLCQIAGVDPDPAELSEQAKCLDGLKPDQQKAIQIWLLCQILSS